MFKNFWFLKEFDSSINKCKSCDLLPRKMLTFYWNFEWIFFLILAIFMGGDIDYASGFCLPFTEKRHLPTQNLTISRNEFQSCPPRLKKLLMPLCWKFITPLWNYGWKQAMSWRNKHEPVWLVTCQTACKFLWAQFEIFHTYQKTLLTFEY